MPGGQTPFQDVEAGVCHTAPMPDGQLIIPSCGLGIGKTISLSSVVGFGHSHAAKISGGLLPTENMSAGVSHKAPMPDDQTHVPCLGVVVCPLAPMPGGCPLPCSGLDHADPGESVLGSLPFILKASVEACQPAPVPGGSGMGQGLLAPMLVGHFISTAGTCEVDEEEVPPNQEGVSPFLHFIGKMRAYLHLPSPEAPSSSQLTGVEMAQGSVLPHQPSLTLPQLLMAEAVFEEVQCRSLKEPKPCSANFQLSRD
ncbi:hypothetical protein E2C01_060901 [Portunus trituberculatus]|uniref:Uncharacterized protein n=1 Tax=Portunus trituberculatus TaxID=210409 RepID=A0A5B7H3U6_PORTR|nr:hypothetical protein [Portunus trituberculatus]